MQLQCNNELGLWAWNLLKVPIYVAGRAGFELATLQTQVTETYH